MSFSTHNPAPPDPAHAAAVSRPISGGGPAPAFRPQLRRSLRMHPVLAGVVAAVVLALLLGYTFTLKTMYQAESQVHIEASPARLLGDPAAPPVDPGRYEAFFELQLQTARQLSVLTSALTTLPPSDWRFLGATAQKAAQNLRSRIQVTRVKSSNEMSIALKDTDPSAIAAIVNAVTASYLQEQRRQTLVETDQRAQLLTEERQRIESELQAARVEQTALGATLGVVNPTSAAGNPYDVELSGLRSQLSLAREAHDLASAQLSSLSGAGGAGGPSGLIAAADEAIAGDPGLSSLKASVSQRRAALIGQMAGMTPANPIYKQDQEEIAGLDRTLESMTADLRDKAARRLQDKLRTDLQRTGDLESRLNGQLSHQIARATSAGPRLQRAAEVAADIQRLNKRFADVDDALRSLHLDASGPGLVHLSMTATVPEFPEPSRKRLLLLAALPLALLLGAAAAVLARRQDPRLFTEFDVESLLGFPPLAVLPARDAVPEPVFDEYILRLAAGIESAGRATGARTFLLTAISDSTAINPLCNALIRKFDRLGLGAILVPAADLLESATGLATAAVAPQPRPSEGIVAANLARLRAAANITLIEAHSIAHSAPAEYLARCADATILVVESGVSRREELTDAAALLQRLHIRGVGVVVEEVHLGTAEPAFRAAVDAAVARSKTPQAAAQAAPSRMADPTAASASESRLTPQPIAVQPDAADAAAGFRTLDFQQPDFQVPDSAPRAEAAFAQPPSPLADDSAPSDIEPDAGFPDAPIPLPRSEPAEKTLASAAAGATVRRGFAGLPPIPAFAVQPARYPSRPLAAVPAESLELEAQPIDREPLEDQRPENPPLETAPQPNETYGLREKMAAGPAVAPQDPAPSDEPDMTRKGSWLARLFGRGEEPVYSILPGGDDEDASPLSAAAVPQPASWQVANRPTSSRPASGSAPAAEMAAAEALEPQRPELPASRAHSPVRASFQAEPRRSSLAPVEFAPVEPAPVQSARVEIAPVEPVQSEPAQSEPAQSEPVQSAPVEPAPLKTPLLGATPAEIALASMTLAELQPIASVPAWEDTPNESAAAPAPPPARARVRPLRFRQLIAQAEAMQPAPRVEDAAASHTASEPVSGMLPERPLAVAESQGSVEAASAAQPGLRAPGSMPPPVAELAAAPAGPAAAAEARPATPAAAAEARPATVPSLGAEAFESQPETPAPQRSSTPEAAAESAPQSASESAPAITPESAPAITPGPIAQPIAAAPAPANPAPERPASVEPVEPLYVPYFELSPPPAGAGRWDPIPPLRPSSLARRDRPVARTVAVGAGGQTAETRRWTGMEYEEDGPVPTLPRPSQSTAAASDAKGEPLLSRQWGLLSRFQQAKLNTAERLKSEPSSDSDPLRETVGPGVSHGSRQA